ncbi:MAG: HNH endonuclease signature motif containing protein [Verrucomicrobiota bacterium]
MKAREIKRAEARIARQLAGRRNPTDYPMPQPTGPCSSNVTPITFDSYRAARSGAGLPAVLKLFKRFGAYSIKPKRGSSGLVWDDRAFWWSTKGFYRHGKTAGRAVDRRPLQHLVWEQHHKLKMPKGMEIFFIDRNRNNFDPANLEMLDKAELHRRCVALGEVTQLTNEQRHLIAGKRWTRFSRNATASLLDSFNRGGSTVAQLKKKS